MKYRILWIPDAEESFEQILNDESRSKYLLRDSVRSINEQLVSKPFEFGESRQEDVYVGFVEPLAVNYQILHDVRTVVVFHIWRTDLR